MVVSCRAPGTSGELIQGSIRGVDFLVSCPIDLYSAVEVELLPSHRGLEIEIAEGYEKTALAIEKTLRYFKGTKVKARAKVESDLLSGKGMGKSTADLCGAIYATTWALKKEIMLTEVKEILLSIEPSDSSFFPNLALMDHRRGRVLYPLPPLPQAKVLIVDLGGEVDTLSFNANQDLFLFNQKKENKIQKAIRLLFEGLAKRDLYRIGEASTMSALAHQEILPKENLEILAEEMRGDGVYGLSVAHSGTLVSILHHREATDFFPMIDALYPKREAIIETTTTSGGARLIRRL